MEDSIMIPKTEKYLESCKEISDYISEMKLPNNNEFVHLLTKHTEIVRQETFKSGIDLGLKLSGIKEEASYEIQFEENLSRALVALARQKEIEVKDIKGIDCLSEYIDFELAAPTNLYNEIKFFLNNKIDEMLK